VIRLEDVRFRYRTGEFRLHLPELLVDARSSVALVGPSGAGKTTLLHLVAGILRPDSGRVVVDGTDIAGLPDGARRAFRVAKIGLVFQEFELLDYLSVLDNVLLPCRIAGALPLDAAMRDRAAALVERFGLADKIRRSVHRLSQGERQRVGVCRALLASPPLLLADEPTGNLDTDNRDIVLDALLGYADESGATVLTVTHDREILDRFDRVVDVRNGTAS
jgi:putative ABC transport system ATP-binding protein